MIYDGSSEIDMIYDGSAEVQAVYDGATEIWTNFKVVSLGAGKTWDIKTLYPNLYNKLSVNNFFFTTATQASGSNRIDMNPGQGRASAGFSCSIAKSYDSNTGALSFYNYISPGDSTNINAVMVVKTDKLIDLGTNTSFDVKSYADYKNFTEDNFLIRSVGTASGGNTYGDPNDVNGGDPYRDDGAATSRIIKSYDNSTGKLSCYLYLKSEDTGGVYHYFDFTASANCRVFLNPKV